MRIALDARSIYSPQRHGIGGRLLTLYQQLAKVRPDWEVVAYHRADNPPGDNELPIGFATTCCIEMPGDRFDAWLRVRLPWAAWRDRCDLLHCPAGLCPSWMPIPTVVSVHDLNPLDMSESANPNHRDQFEQSLHHARRGAATIHCPLHYTRQRLINEHRFVPQRVHVTPFGVDDSLHAEDPSRIQPVLESLGVARPYVLHFGGPERHKNTQQVIESWALLRSQIRRRWKLLVVGLNKETQTELQTVVERLGISDHVVLHRFVPRKAMEVALSAAELLAYPSLSDGMGQPILEAFSVGTAVLTSNRGSLPEVAGDAAMLIDPRDFCSITNGLTRMMRDRVLRLEYAERGKLRAKHFAWKDMAERFARMLEQAAGKASQQRLAA